MNSKMREIMETSWQEWHGDFCVPVNISYEKGFDAACEKLMPLLEASANHVYGSADACHIMCDGANPSRLPIDDLVDSIKAVTRNEIVQ